MEGKRNDETYPKDEKSKERRSGSVTRYKLRDTYDAPAEMPYGGLQRI
jgi:hypothetical protein